MKSNSAPSSRGSSELRLPSHSRQALHRLAILTVGLACLSIGLIQMQAAPGILPPPLEALNEYYRLDINNLDKVMWALPLLVIGAVLVVKAGENLTGRSTMITEGGQSQPFSWRPILNCRWLAIGLGIALVLHLQLAMLGYSSVSALLWLSSIAILGYTAIHWDRARGIHPTTGLKAFDLYIVLTIVAAGLFILSYRLQDLPMVLIGDEPAFFHLAKRLLQGETDLSLFSSGVYSFPAFSTYIQAAVLQLVGLDLWGWRFASVIPTLFTIPALYLLAYRLYGRRCAIISCLLFITLPYTLSYSRLGYNSSQTWPFVTAAAAFLLLAVRQRSVWWVFLAGLAGGLGTLTYPAAGILPVSGLVYLSYRSLTDRSDRKWHIASVLIFAAGVGLVTSPQLNYGLMKDRPSVTAKLLESAFTNREYVADLFEVPTDFDDWPNTNNRENVHVLNAGVLHRVVVRGVTRTAVAFFSRDMIDHHFLVGPLAGIPGAAFMLIGLTASVRAHVHPGRRLVLFWLGLGFLSLSALNTFPPRPGHLVGISPLIPVLTAAGLLFVVDAVRSCVPRIKPRAGTALLAITTTAMALLGMKAYFITMPDKYRPDLESAISWAGLYEPRRPIYYLHTDPTRMEHAPYIFKEIKVGLPYHNVFLNPGNPQQLRLPVHQSALVFTTEQDYVLAAELVRKVWGPATKIDTLTDREGEPRIRVFKNGAFSIYPDRTWLQRVWESYATTPIKWILLAIPVLAAFIHYGPKLGHRIRRYAIHFLVWLTEPPASKD